MKPRIKLVAAIAAFSIALVACGDDKTSDAASADAAPADTAVEAAAEGPKIVSLSPTATEMLFAIGAGDLVIAADSYSTFPAEAPVTDLSAYEPNAEAIAGYEPDLVVLSNDSADGIVKQLEALEIETLMLPAAATIEDTYAELEQLGAATGHVGDAAEVVANMQADIAEIVASVTPPATPLTYYHELDNTYYSVTSSTFIGQVYSLLGLENIADAADDGSAGGYPQMTAEAIIAADPDLVFLADTKCCQQDAAAVAARPGWDTLSAVKAGNVVELDDDVASRWGPRIVDLMKVVADAVSKVSVG